MRVARIFYCRKAGTRAVPFGPIRTRHILLSELFCHHSNAVKFISLYSLQALGVAHSEVSQVEHKADYVILYCRPRATTRSLYLGIIFRSFAGVRFVNGGAERRSKSNY